MSDNDHVFAEFSCFSENQWCQAYLLCAYCPTSNELAEIFTRTFNQAMKAAEAQYASGGEIVTILGYHSMAHSMTGRTRQPTISVERIAHQGTHQLKPSCDSHVADQQAEQVATPQPAFFSLKFAMGQQVVARTFRFEDSRTSSNRAPYQHNSHRIWLSVEMLHWPLGRQS